MNPNICYKRNILTVEDKISWGQHASRKLLQTFGSEYFTWNLLFSPEKKKHVNREFSVYSNYNGR